MSVIPRTSGPVRVEVKPTDANRPVSSAPVPDADAVDHAIMESLIERRRLSAADGERLRELRKSQGTRLARLLVNAGVLSQENLRDELAKRLSIPAWEADAEADVDDTSEADEQAARLLPPTFLRFNQVIPVEVDDERVRLAMVWAPDEALVESVRQATGRRVEPMVATQRDVEAGLTRLLSSVETESREDESSDVRMLDPDTLRDLASEAPVVQFLTAALERAVTLGASDIHLERTERRARLRYRVDGELIDVDAPAPALYAGLVSRIKIMARLDVGERRLPQDGRIRIQTSGREIDIRVSILPSLHGEDVVLRILDRGAVQLNLDDLGLSERQREQFRRIITRPEGMLLLTGPTGSGKTTTLYSGLREIARPNVKVVTVEDPVEYHLDGVNQIQVRSEIGLDFARCLRSILRHDPDVIMVGEIRDRETAAMAVQSALTGHLVLSTLHTNSAAATFARLQDMGVENYLIASAVIGVMAQRLLRRVCKDCREPYAPDAAIRERHGLAPGAMFHRGAGCRACLGTGYRGRTVVGELLLVDERVQRVVLDGKSSAEIHRVAHDDCGMESLWEHAVSKVVRGETTYEQIIENIQE